MTHPPICNYPPQTGAVVQCLLGVGTEALLGVSERRGAPHCNAPGQIGYERMRRAVREGRLWGGMPDVVAAAGDRWAPEGAKPAAATNGFAKHHAIDGDDDTVAARDARPKRA
jgi:hypothetical protein